MVAHAPHPKRCGLQGHLRLAAARGRPRLEDGEESSIQSYVDARIDIRHVFPQGRRRENGIESARCDSIINKTPLTAGTNRSIGGHAPSEYLERIKVPQDRLDKYHRTHLIDPAHLRTNDFDGFFAARQSALLGVIQKEMGKQIAPDTTEEGVEPPVDYELVQQDSMASVSVPE